MQFCLCEDNWSVFIIVDNFNKLVIDEFDTGGHLFVVFYTYRLFLCFILSFFVFF
jgi:hypothetical protein